MATLIDLGDCFIVKDKISAVSKEGDTTINVFIPSTPRGFGLNCADKEMQETLFEKLKKMMLENN